MAENMIVAKWHKELEIFYRIKSSIILEGNIYDSFRFPEGELKGAWLTLNQYLEAFFAEKGYENVVFYNPIDGFIASEETALSKFGEIVGMNVEDGKIAAKFDASETGAPVLIKEALANGESSTVIVMDMASRYIIAPDHLYPADLQCYTILKQAFLGAADVNTKEGRVENMLVFITDKQNDLPSWIYFNVNRIKGIQIEYPNAEQRKSFLLQDDMVNFFDSEIFKEDCENYKDKPEEREKLIDQFVARTEGLTFFELMQLRKLAISEKVHLSKICSVVDLYTYGIKENPWEKEDLSNRLTRGEEILKKRVKGQDEAISQSLDVLKRAVSGLSKVKNNASPKGVLFFAGPTGTGKTETAKTLAELVFGDESACIRFDMSEYSHDNSDQRLFGAPPGYVGYEAGGQLTNAVRKNPFSILLFDEIEKASPTILDKFLQILEDGRMTDGQGNTAYFSDCVIIFTSNLGIYTKDQYGNRKENVNRSMSPDEVRTKVTTAIQDHFKLELGRPEILNRIGENIVIFRYINEDVAREILTARVEGIVKMIALQKEIRIDVSPVFEKLYGLVCENLDNGGRGINNIVEKALINPLARHIFDDAIQAGEARVVTDIVKKDSGYDLVLESRQV